MRGKLKKDYWIIKFSKLFDPAYYLKQYPDVRKADVDPIEHYVLYGWKEGRNPNPSFDTRYYLENNPDVAQSCINPFLHYILYGAKERRKTIPSFTNTPYLMNLNYSLMEAIDIEKYDYFFLDVFDTTIIRLCRKPTDVFRYISFVKNEPDFYIKRVRKEAETRKHYNSRKDISIFNIYEKFDEAKLEEELDTEFKFCIANPDIFLFYKKLLLAKKKIYFISDVYLDKSTVSKILDNNGFTIYEDIFISSEDDLIKGDGSRFEWIRNKYPHAVGHSIHIGDNIIADFEQPKKYGFDAFHYVTSDDYYRNDPFISTKIEFFNSSNSLGISFILGMFRYWKSTFLNQSVSYWRQFGFLYGGALVSRFCCFIRDQILKNKLSCNRIFFLGRDGDIISKVYQMLFNDIEGINLLASRRAIIFPAIKNLDKFEDKNELFHFISPVHTQNVKDIIERFSYFDLYELEYDLNEISLEQSTFTEEQIYNCILKNKNFIMEKITSERVLLFHYLSSVKFFDQNDIVVVDVGWGGTIQNSLMKLLNIWEMKGKRIFGIYMGVNENVLQKEHKKGFLFDGNRTNFAEYLELIELLTSSPQDPIIRIDYINGSFVPYSGKITKEEMKRQLVACDIQKGIIDFTNIAKERNFDLRFIEPEDIKILFDSLKHFPSEDDLVQLGQLKHARMIGNRYDLPIIHLKSSEKTVIRHDIKIISVCVNPEMYHRFFINNTNINRYELIYIDNRKYNYGLPKIYNEIIEEYKDENCWLFFVHEDLEIKSSLSIIYSLDPHCIYGTFGIKLEHGYIPVAYGKHICSNKDGSEAVETGIEIFAPVNVQTLDCQSILINTSLLRKYLSLRFDENLTFDLYVEDFCINAHENHGLDVKVFPLQFQHYSHGKMLERYYNGLQYLAQKYPNIAVPGSCSFIGGKAVELERKFTYQIRAKQK